MTHKAGAPQGESAPTERVLGESHTVLRLRDLTRDDLFALKSTVPDPDWKPEDATATMSGVAVGYLTYEFFGSIEWALAPLILGFAYDLAGKLAPRGEPKTQLPKLQRAGSARGTIKRALAGSDEALSQELLMVSYLDRDTVVFQLPGASSGGEGATWFAPPKHEDTAKWLRDIVTLRSLGMQLSRAADAPYQHAWSKAWRDHVPAVRQRASSRASELEESMVEIAKLLDPIVQPPDCAAEVLATLRSECTHAIVIYCEVPPDDTNVVLPPGTTATDVFAELLDVVVTSARRINSDVAFTDSDAASVRQRLSEVRFTRSDLELP